MDAPKDVSTGRGRVVAVGAETDPAVTVGAAVLYPGHGTAGMAGVAGGHFRLVSAVEPHPDVPFVGLLACFVGFFFRISIFQSPASFFVGRDDHHGTRN